MTAPTWLVQLLMDERDRYPRHFSDIPSERLAEVITAELRARLESEDMGRHVRAAAILDPYRGRERIEVALAAVADELLGGSDE